MEKIIEIKNLSVSYKNLKKNTETTRPAVNNVSFHINQGDIYALAGESGCGKSTIAKSIMKLIKPNQGEILFKGENIQNIKKEYATKVQMVFQNPYSSLNPKMKIKDILEEPLLINTKNTKEKNITLIKEIIEDVGLEENSLKLYPHQFSGGQRQRIAIARALILKPEFLIADEPVSALDASIQAQIINLLKELKNKRNLTILFISHDLNVIRYIADRVGIMYYGEKIEEGEAYTIFKYPKTEYTKTLLNSSPEIKNK